MKSKPSMKQRMKKLKKASSKKLEQTTKGVQSTLNINRYNKLLFIFETILLVGVVDEFFEGVVTGLSLNIYLHVLLLMLAVGILFTLAFSFLEPWTKKLIVWTVRINQNKILRFLMHVIILAVLYYFYAKVFFGTTIGINFSLGLSAN